MGWFDCFTLLLLICSLNDAKRDKRLFQFVFNVDETYPTFELPGPRYDPKFAPSHLTDNGAQLYRALYKQYFLQKEVLSDLYLAGIPRRSKLIYAEDLQSTFGGAFIFASLLTSTGRNLKNSGQNSPIEIKPYQSFNDDCQARNDYFKQFYANHELFRKNENLFKFLSDNTGTNIDLSTLDYVTSNLEMSSIDWINETISGEIAQISSRVTDDYFNDDQILKFICGTLIQDIFLGAIRAGESKVNRTIVGYSVSKKSMDCLEAILSSKKAKSYAKKDTNSIKQVALFFETYASGDVMYTEIHHAYEPKNEHMKFCGGGRKCAESDLINFLKSSPYPVSKTKMKDVCSTEVVIGGLSSFYGLSSDMKVGLLLLLSIVSCLLLFVILVLGIIVLRQRSKLTNYNNINKIVDENCGRKVKPIPKTRKKKLDRTSSNELTLMMVAPDPKPKDSLPSHSGSNSPSQPRSRSGSPSGSSTDVDEKRDVDSLSHADSVSVQSSVRNYSHVDSPGHTSASGRHSTTPTPNEVRITVEPRKIP